MTPIRWTTPARRDLREHLDYLAIRNPETAIALAEAVQGAVERLAAYPFRGRPGRRDGTRELVIVGWPYVVIYAASEARVMVLRILHTAQDWPPRQGGQESR